MKGLKLFLINGIALATTSVVLRFADVWFNAYLSRQMESHGMGIMQLIMSAYFIGVNVAVSGIGLATTRLVAEELANKNELGVKTAVKKCLSYGAFFGIGACALLYHFAEFIAINFLKTAEAVLPLKVFAFSLPFIALSSVFEGYFMASRSAAKAASEHIVEKTARIMIVAFLLESFTDGEFGFPYTAIALGAVVSEAISCLWLTALYVFDKRKHRNLRKSNNLTSRMLGIALPVAVSSYLRSGLSGLKHMMIPVWLAKSGMGKVKALEGYGMVHGMAMPVIMFPSALIGAFASLVIPEAARLYARKNKEGINSAVKTVFRTTLIFAIGTAGILMCWSDEIALAVYKRVEIGVYLRLLAPLTVIMYFDEVADGLLKGINKQVAVVGINIFDTVVCILLIVILLPAYGTVGYIMMIFISELLNGFLSIGCVLRNTESEINIVDWFIKPVLNVSVSCYFARFFVLPHFSMNIIIAITLYIGLTCGMDLFRKKVCCFTAT